MKPLILVTGANGFVGRGLLKKLEQDGSFQVRVATRGDRSSVPEYVQHVLVGDLSRNTDWSEAIAGVDVIIHLAARAHILNDTSDDPLVEFRNMNTYVTENLANQAAAVGVKRFIFISTIGVNGASTVAGVRFSELDEVHPHNAYAQSKWEAEQKLREIASNSTMEAVIIRPPLVYGGDAGGNFGMLLRILYRNWPLPLGSVKNCRSFISLPNVTDFIIQTIGHHAAANLSLIHI